MAHACFLNLLLLVGAMIVSSQLALANGPLDMKHHHRRSKLRHGEDLITQLPGLDYNPGFRQYSGYLTVSEEDGRNIFYWYVESQNNPKTDPVVLWTNGGPGCSGLMGLLEEHGPYIIEKNLQLAPNPYSWNKVANMLYIEQPAGVGFSFSKNATDYFTGDAEAAKDNFQLILEFFKRFPDRRSNDFYIAGESYGGHYIPQLAFEILGSNANGMINFKGLLVGNPAVDFFQRLQFQVRTLFFRGLIPEYIFTDWTHSCDTFPKFNTVDCEKLYWTIVSMPGGGILPHAPDFPVCTEQPLYHNGKMSSLSPQALQLNRHNRSKTTPNVSDLRGVYHPCASLRSYEYLNREDVRRALHINDQWSAKNWTKCSSVVHYRVLDQFQDVTYLFQQLVDMAQARQHILNMLIYSGDDDSTCGTAGTQFWMSELGVSGKSNQTWVPWVVDEQTAGFVTEYELGHGVLAKFTFATVHGAGHEVPSYRPKQALILFQRYLSGQW